MIYFLELIFILISFLLQVAIIPEQWFGDVTPNFLLVAVTLLAIYRGKTTGGIIGFVAGLLQDWFSGGLFGIHALSKTIIGYLFGFLRTNIYHKNILVAPLAVLMATVINQFLVFGITGYLLSDLSIEMLAKNFILPLLMYNSFLSLVINPFVQWMDYYLTGRNFM